MTQVTGSTFGRPHPRRRPCHILQRRVVAPSCAPRVRRRRRQCHLIDLHETEIRHRRQSRSRPHFLFRCSHRRCRVWLAVSFRLTQRRTTQFHSRQRAEAHRREQKNIFCRPSPPIVNRNISESGAAIGARSCLPTFSPTMVLSLPSRRRWLRLRLASPAKPSSVGLKTELFPAARSETDGWSRSPRSDKYSKT